MPSNDDKDDLLPTRSGSAIGKVSEGRMLSSVGGPDGIRTRILIDGNRTTILRTRGGHPHFHTTEASTDEQQEVFFYAIECSAIGGSGNTYKHVAVSTHGRVKTLSKQKYYGKFSFVNEWVGYNETPGDGLDKHSLRWCGMDQSGGYVGCFRRDTLSSTDTPRWDYSKPLSGVWDDTTTVAFAPPGSPLGWRPWGYTSGAEITPQFSNESASGYGALAQLQGGGSGGLDGAFQTMVSGTPHVCSISITDFSKLTSTTPRTTFATVNDITAGSAANIVFGSPPAAYSTFSYSGRIARQPIVVNGTGTRAVAEVYARFYTASIGTVTGVCVLDIDLVSNTARVLSYAGERSNYFNFGFIDNTLTAAWMLNATPSTTGKAAVVGNRVLVRTPAAAGWVNDATILFADYGRKLFIVRVSDAGYSVDHSVYLVFYKWRVVKKFYIEVAYDGVMTYTAAEISESGPGGFPAHSTPENEELVAGAAVDWVTTYSGGSKVFEPTQQPTYGVAYAGVDAKGKTIAISVTLNHMQVGNVSESVAVWNGPRVLNKVIKVSSGASKAFGNSGKFYNRLHFQDFL